MTIGTPFSVIISTTSSQVNRSDLDSSSIDFFGWGGGGGGKSGPNDYDCDSKSKHFYLISRVFSNRRHVSWVRQDMINSYEF